MKILDFNHCNFENCNCGWNIIIGGSDGKELKALKAFLKGKTEDKTDYNKKLSTKGFFNPEKIDNLNDSKAELRKEGI